MLVVDMLFAVTASARNRTVDIVLAVMVLAVTDPNNATPVDICKTFKVLLIFT
jgi:hypothetical protein